jgi:hypothetical protein
MKPFGRSLAVVDYSEYRQRPPLHVPSSLVFFAVANPDWIGEPFIALHQAGQDVIQHIYSARINRPEAA